MTGTLEGAGDAGRIGVEERTIVGDRILDVDTGDPDVAGRNRKLS